MKPPYLRAAAAASTAGAALAAALCLLPLPGARTAAASARPVAADSIPAPPAGDSLTVEACAELARRHAPAVAAARFDREAAASDSAATAANRRPDFAIVSGATVAPRGFYDPTITNLGEYELKLGADWILSDGGRRARARARGGLDAAAARSRLALEARDAGWEAAGFAFAWLRAEEGASIEQGSLAWLERLATLVRAGVASGSRGASDSVRVALERDAAASDVESARLDAASAMLQLEVLIGRDGESPVAIVAPAEGGDRPPAAEDSIRLLASVDRQPEVALARIAEATSRLDLLDARRRTAAEVDLSADAGLAGADLTRAVPEDLRASDPDATFADRLRRDLGASAAIHVRLPLLDRGAAPARRAREAALGATAARTQGEEASQRARLLSLLARWRSAGRRVEAARAAGDRADANLLALKSLYAAGATTLLDLLDARRTLDEALRRLADARWEARMARFEAEHQP